MKQFLLAAATASALFASCNTNTVEGDGHVISKNFPQKDFKGIDARSALNVHIKQGPDYSVKVDAEENLLHLMKVYVEKDQLVVGFGNNTSVNPTKPIEVYVTAPEFRHLEGSGACNLYAEQTIKGNEIILSLSGASNADLAIEANKLGVDASGSTEINLKGKVAYLSVDGSGTTDIKAFPLMSDNTKIDISGAGEAEVWAAQTLKVEISGAGTVKYKGNPATIKKDISGAGDVKHVD
ncbi:head GIN domain-containing protein [Taibaiella koreensis]|uniref:head GIN domain-containing protein n=1 Tax=Taibaiella koreensis TaxID=1268548 RepID=UPI000E59D81E|nr:head GIN domain-containing protein [Taibaiella koreensis]